MTRTRGDPTDWFDAAGGTHYRRLFASTPAGGRLLYADMLSQTARIAAALAQCGVEPGERVLCRIEKSLDAVLLYLACLRYGAVFVPVNPAGTPAEFDHLLRDAQPRLIVLDPHAGTELAAAGARTLTVGADGTGSLAALAARCAPLALEDEAVAVPGAVAAIVYTSGTTGRPKGAMLTRANLASNAGALARAWRFTADDVLLHVLPLFHVHGLCVALNTVLASGASLVLQPKFEPQAALAALAEATVFMGVPTLYTRLLKEPGLDPRSTARLRLFVSGSAPLLAETHREFERRTGHTILERYGMTETLMISSNPYDGPRLPGSVGPPLEGVAVRVTDAGGAAQPQGVVGGFEVRGPSVFAGYWRDAHKTQAEFTADGWFRTGDVGRLDEAGYLWILGRAKDLVISGGYNVYPKEVETELDAVAGVAESAVFGVPHPDYGEAVTAAVVAEAGAALAEGDLIEAVRSRLSAYKVPKRVLLVPELPRNAMGKVRKELLRASYAKLYQPP